MAEQKLTQEEMFRSNLEDVIAVVKKLQGICNTTAELVEVCELALISDAQLRLLMREAQSRK